MRKLFSIFAAMLVVLAVNAATTEVSPGKNALQTAVAAAAAGDVLVLGDGIFYEEGNFDMKINLTIKAADGAKPVIANRYYFRVEGGADVTFQGIKFDGAGWRDGDAAPLGASDYLIRSYNASTGEEDITFEDCEITGYPSYVMYTQRANRKWNSITINGCYFYSNVRSAVYIGNESGTEQSCNALTIKNSTFANVTDSYDVIYYAAPAENHTTPLSVDHCTFYGHPKRAIYWQVSENLTVTNCIFAQPASVSYKSVECVAGSISNCLSYNSAGYSSAATSTNNIVEDPLFKDAANNDFTLGAGSPALTAGSDGKPIGDPRWVPSVAPEVKYYLKNNWDAASDWTWKEMTKEDEDDYQLVGVVFGGTGVNVNTAESDEGADWYPIADIATYDASLEPTTLKAKDTVVFMYTPSEKILAAIVVGPYVEPEPQPVKTAIYDWAGKVGTTILGTNGVEVSTVKIHTNKDEIPAIKFGSSYVYADGKWLAIKPAEGGFKAGDVVSISGVISNTDDTGAKYAQIDMYAADGSTRLLRTENVVNGRVSANDPFVDVITLESDQDSLFFGRYGNTTMFITMLKVERAGGAPEPAHTYTVAGSSAIAFGTAWTPANTDNDMVKQEDGTYKWEKSNLELPAGTIEFKVCQDHAWATCWPAQNYALNVSEAATYTLTITFNPANENVGAELTKTGSAEIDPAASAKGSWDGWAAELVFVLADNKETASGILNLEPGDYEFKVILNDGDWRSNGYSYHREFTGAENITGNGDNMVLKADIAGDYTLTWTFATNALNITFPVPSGIDNTNVAVKAQKVIVNGQLFIIRDGQMFNAQGQLQ